MTQSFLIRFLNGLFCLLSLQIYAAPPGQVGNEGVSVAKIGNTDIYFYMTPEKHQAAFDMVKELNNKKLLLVADVYEEPVLTTEISALASISPEQIHADPEGNKVLDRYAEKVVAIMKKELAIPEVLGMSREINLIVSQDAHKFHQDQFKRQYDFLSLLHGKLPTCKLVHDLTLIDWNMSQGTISGTIFQDTGGDRLLVTLFPGEVIGMLTVEMPIYPEDGQAPTFPGPISLPYHAVLSPVDFFGGKSSGSPKGQRISTVIRGLTPAQKLDYLEAIAKPLTILRPIQLPTKDGYEYENGIVVKELPINERFPSKITWNYRFPDAENMEILQTKPEDHVKNIELIKKLFNIKCRNVKKVQVRHLIKRESGFSKLYLGDLGIDPNSVIVLLNKSQFPKGYKYFNLAEDCRDKGFPWIHLYQFKPETAMLIKDPQLFNRLMLTPLEELLFRNEVLDVDLTDGTHLVPKFVTQIDLFAFPQ